MSEDSRMHSDLKQAGDHGKRAVAELPQPVRRLKQVYREVNARLEEQ